VTGNISCSYCKCFGYTKKPKAHHTVSVNNNVSQRSIFKSMKVLILEKTTLPLSVFSLPTKSLKTVPLGLISLKKINMYLRLQ
jgi:hypothetical protein